LIFNEFNQRCSSLYGSPPSGGVYKTKSYTKKLKINGFWLFEAGTDDYSPMLILWVIVRHQAFSKKNSADTPAHRKCGFLQVSGAVCRRISFGGVSLNFVRRQVRRMKFSGT
jgi:hypothetical protein